MARKIVDIVHDRREGQLQDAIRQNTANGNKILALEWWVTIEVCFKDTIAIWEAWESLVSQILQII